MPKFNILEPVVDMYDRPVRSGTITDVAERRKIAAMLDTVNSSAADKRAVLECDYQIASESAQEPLTAGRAAIMALTQPLPGDDSMPGAAKLDLFEWAIKIKRAMESPDLPREVEFDNSQMDRIKLRVSSCFPSPMIAAQVLRAFE